MLKQNKKNKKLQGGNVDKILAMADKTTNAYNLVENIKLELKTIGEEIDKAPEGNKKELLQQFNAATQALEKAKNNLNKHLENPGSEGNNNNDVVNDKTGPFKWGGRVLIGVVIIVGIAAVTAN
jgi:seryl-tRNA synthetase